MDDGGETSSRQKERGQQQGCISEHKVEIHTPQSIRRGGRDMKFESFFILYNGKVSVNKSRLFFDRLVSNLKTTTNRVGGRGGDGDRDRMPDARK